MKEAGFENVIDQGYLRRRRIRAKLPRPRRAVEEGSGTATIKPKSSGATKGQTRMALPLGGDPHRELGQ
jgi:hypothetical protein